MIILLIEDHERLAYFISKGLEADAITVDSFQRGDEGLKALDQIKYDAIILDLGLPDTDGLEILRNLREAGNQIPVLILTSRIQVADRVNGLNAGADDYLTKPFAMEELTARLRALFRRPSKSLGEVISVGNLSFNVQNHELRIDKEPLSLSKREASLLEQLLRRKGHVVPKADIEDSLFGLNESTSANTVEVLVHRLRKRLSNSGSNVSIHTFRGVGYMLVVDLPVSTGQPGTDSI